MKTEKLQISRNLSELEKVRDHVRNFLQDDFDAIESNRIILSVDEALANILEHGTFQSIPPKIQIEMKQENDVFIFMIDDNGDPFNPLVLPPVDLEEHANSGEEGGLGVFLYTTLMDAEYSNESGGNRLTLSKKISRRRHL